MWQIAALGLLLSVSADTCPKYTCEEKPISEGVCAWPDETDFTVHLSICSSSLNPYCDIPVVVSGNVECTTYRAADLEDRYPGEACNIDDECIGESHCVYHVCSGYVVGSRCSAHSQCDVGLYCNDDGRCAAQKRLGETCKYDEDCKNDLGCNDIDADTDIGVCVKYYSLAIGAPLSKCISVVGESFNSLCSSGVCTPTDSTVFDGPGVCSESVTSQKTLPTSCTKDADCVGTNSSGTLYTGTCTCGVEEDGTSYCELWSGDTPYIEVREEYVNHFNNVGVHFCHTEDRLDQTCFARTLTSDKATGLARNKILVKEYPRLQSESKCIQNIYNRDYDLIVDSIFKTASYNCTDATTFPNSCIEYDDTTNNYSLNTCDSSYGSQARDYTLAVKNSWEEVTCSTNYPTDKKYPGESCETSADCLYNWGDNTCSDNICQGVQKDEHCDSNDAYTCHPGLYCKINDKTSTCQSLLKEGEVCYSDWECDYGYGCNYVDITATSGTCTGYFSVIDKESVTCAITGEQYLCKSSWCNHSGGNSGYCIDAPKSTSTTPIACELDSECEGKNSVGTVYSKCRAGYNDEGLNYCDLFPGDSEGVVHTNYLANYISSSLLNKCQTSLRFSEYCINAAAYGSYSNDDAFKVIQKHMIYKSKALYTNNSDCIKELFTRDYWSDQPGPGPNPDPDDDDTDDNDDNDDDFSLRLLMSAALLFVLG